MNRVVANLKSLSIDMINKAGSGHPGIVLSAAPTLYTLYAYHMNINPKDPNWLNRDRFVLSAGHGSALLYAMLYMLDFITLKDLKQFRQTHSNTPGHPELNTTPGVDMSTGPLGQGVASAVGMAIGLKHLKAKLEKTNLISNYVYVLCSDGDLMEGISYEATSLAGTLKLDNLIILYDSNNISLDASTQITFTEDVKERFDAFGFYTTTVRNGNNINEINRAIKRAKKSKLPSFIEIKTILGDGTTLAGTNQVHGKPLSPEEITKLKEKLNVNNTPFWTDEKAIQEFREYTSNRISDKYTRWTKEYNMYLTTHPKFKDFLNRKVTFQVYDNPFTEIKEEATRDSAYRILNFFEKNTDLLFGGSADVSSSTKTYLENGKKFTKENYSGKNIFFGVREHAMGAILNGIASIGYLPFGSTFLAFSDYLKPAIRMSALMNLPVTYIFTHDSLYVGEDGPTHQPIEQLSALRGIPNLTVYRPADFKETLGVFSAVIALKKPSAIILSKQKLPLLANTNSKKIVHGAYTVYQETKEPTVIIIATGSEVSLAIDIAKELKEYSIRVVSMPSIELFLQMPKTYQYSILPVGVKTFFIEAASSQELRHFVSNDKYLININSFGQSGKPQDILTAKNFTKEQIVKQIRTFL